MTAASVESWQPMRCFAVPNGTKSSRSQVDHPTPQVGSEKGGSDFGQVLVTVKFAKDVFDRKQAISRVVDARP